MIFSVVKSLFRRLGYDVHKHPLPDWYLLRAGLLEIFTAHQINCVIDVGANRGQFGDFLRRIGYKGRIVSFEPVSTNFTHLTERTESDPDWHIHHLAAGASAGTLEINVAQDTQFSSLLPPNKYGGTQFAEEMIVARKEQVQVVRLDSMMEDIIKGLQSPHVYLKMDTQGFDLQVIEGASDCLSQILGLQSEISLKPIYDGMPSYLRSLEKFNEFGFSVTSLIPVNRDAHMQVIEFDCLMVRSR